MSTVERPGAPWRVSVVICAYTEERWLDILAAVESVSAQSLPAEECLLVVDHNPELASRARREIEGCRVVESSGPRGLSGARNTGVELARGDVVAFLDDDAVAAEDWLERLAAAYDDPRVVAAGGRVSPAWVARRPAWFPREFDWVVGCSHSGMPNAPAAVRNLVGANMSFRRDVLRELGGFTSSLGRNGADAAGCEETELCIRAGTIRPGAVVLYDPRAEVFHRVPPVRGTWAYYLRRCRGEGRSKAAVASLAGTASGLSTERDYVRSTLPRGVAAALGETLRGRPASVGRAAAIVAGLAATVVGYATAHGGAAQHARRNALGVLAPAIALALWVSVLLGNVRLSAMTDLGLISVLPFRFWLALVLLCVSFCLFVRRRPLSPLVLAAHVAVLLAMLHATPAVLYDTLRYAWAWKHVAITDFVIAHHGVDLSLSSPTMVAYQDWPGFFTLNALVTGASGLSTPLSYASWAPLVNEALYAFPLMIIFGRLSKDPRVRWTALWIFYLGNWIGQDYFSPQGFAFFLYLVVIAVVLSVFVLPPAEGSRIGLGPRHRNLRRAERARQPRRSPSLIGASTAGDLAGSAMATLGLAPLTAPALAGAAPSADTRRPARGAHRRAARMPGGRMLSATLGALGSGRFTPRLAVAAPAPALATTGSDERRRMVCAYALVVLCTCAVAVSHQLTPFMLVGALILLALSRRLRFYSLALLSLVIAVGWMAIGARTFVADNFSALYSGIGDFFSNATVAKYNAGQASPDQLLIADVDRLYTAAVGLLALLGGLRCLRAGRLSQMLPAVLLILAPVGALAANSYGGEIVFRVYLFALPFLALFAATLFERRGTSRSGALLDVARGAAVLALLAGFAVSYYGKERSNYFSSGEVATIERFYASIPADSLIVSAAGNFPMPVHHYNTYEDYMFTTDVTAAVRAIEAHPADQLARDLGGPKPSYLVFADSDAALVEMSGALPKGEYQRIEDAVLASHLFRVVVDQSGVVILTLAGR